VNALVVFPDGRLASGSGDGAIRIWNLETGICESTLKGTSQDLQCLAVLTDGRLAAGSEDGLIDVWNPITEILEDTLESHTPFGVSCLVSLANGRLISGYSIIQAWDLPEGSHQILDDTSCSDGFLAVLNDGRLATSSFGASIQIWNLDKRICETTLDVFSHQVIQRSAAAGGTAGG
jgi:WD40 repeat protein